MPEDNCDRVGSNYTVNDILKEIERDEKLIGNYVTFNPKVKIG